jgi:hypothetical protein
MGNFDSVIISAGLQRSPRSVLKSDVGPKAMNAPRISILLSARYPVRDYCMRNHRQN